MGIYLDNAATSFPKPKAVADAVYDFMINNGTSSGRGSYKKAMQSDYIVYECRKLIGKLFNFENPKKVVLTSNVTDSLNIAIRGILKENDHVITSSLEHNAVWRCLKTLERDINIKIDTVECSEEGITNPEDIKKYIRKDTALIVFTQASNVLGTIQPIKEIGKIARENNIPFLVDAAQSAGAMKIDVKEDNIDILAFTGHKSLLGPMGTGGLIINTDIDIKPLKAGGTGGDSAYEYQPDYYPNHLETGTSNVSGIAGLREAIKFLNKEGIENIHNKEKELTKYALQKLETVKDIEIYGPKDCEKILSVISFNIKDRKPENVGRILDQKYDIMLRAGLHCAPTAHSVINTKERGTLRIGIGYFNTKEDIDKLVEALNNL
ncbi:aminotransferase class V-fold PLP-dependent enzyme [Intestinibacter sp.]|uniref:aminotransferase class V-fold PLP-dependent enzyme n=1 Tax=Intestinibacter sp. TaxID=1965304 RepID=UPI002A9192CD|nr:aminotransferase class V-fold PLP-dependent enzyme [Intestinibacter sp.]MDY5211080.1 aminotransferase class V-fold PLP-dependent enzyme [Intestinibacter sp.]